MVICNTLIRCKSSEDSLKLRNFLLKIKVKKWCNNKNISNLKIWNNTYKVYEEKTVYHLDNNILSYSCDDYYFREYRSDYIHMKVYDVNKFIKEYEKKAQ